MIAPLRIRLTRTSATHHRLETVRADGSRERCELESRSCLWHDLVHFAVEMAAGLRDSFYGRIASGVSYAALAQPDSTSATDEELWQTERVVGALQGAWKNGLEPGAFVTAFARYLQSIDARCPSWLDEVVVARIGEHLRRLEGQWRATPFGATMELRFEIGDRSQQPTQAGPVALPSGSKAAAGQASRGRS